MAIVLSITTPQLPTLIECRPNPLSPRSMVTWHSAHVPLQHVHPLTAHLPRRLYMAQGIYPPFVRARKIPGAASDAAVNILIHHMTSRRFVWAVQTHGVVPALGNNTCIQHTLLYTSSPGMKFTFASPASQTTSTQPATAFTISASIRYTTTSIFPR